MSEIDINNIENGSFDSYRSIRPLPYELRERCVMYLEEGLYTQALTLLTNLLVAGHAQRPPIPTIVPSPAILAVLATLAIHPRSTTRTDVQDTIIASNQALSYLRHVLKITGSINAQFSAAFAFTDARLRKNRKSNMYNSIDGEAQDARSEDEDFMENDFANDRAVWAKADDFWHIIGWAFSCSATYPLRWQRWKLFLGFMLDVLEDDFDQRLDVAQKEDPDAWQSSSLLRESLIMQYLAKATHLERHARTRILRAVFATGSAANSTEFREIFANETKPMRKKEELIRSSRKKLNLEEDDFGDYFDDDDDSDDKENTPRIKEEPGLRLSTRASRALARTPSATGKNKSSEDRDAMELYGGPEALELRRRCLLLLMRVATAIPEEFTTADEICDLTAETLRKLPLPVFAYFMLPSPSYPWPILSHSALIKFLFKPLLAVDPPHHIDQKFVERQYLPMAASNKTPVANAKASIALESLLRLLQKSNLLQYTESLERAVKQGIEVREAATRKHDCSSREDAEAEGWLGLSAMRLEMFLKMMKNV